MSNPILTLIVDDELPGRLNLRYALEEYPHWQVSGEAHSASQARQLLQQQRFDVLFLDVQMPQESGLELARSLYRQSQSDPDTDAGSDVLRYPLPFIVFVTAYNAYAVQAFEVHALDYLLKPFDDERFAQTVHRVQNQLQQRARHSQAMRTWASDSAVANPQAYWQVLSIHSLGMIERLSLDEVLWIASAGNYVELHLAKRTILHRVVMHQMEQKLDPDCFVRIHRGTIVRVDQCRILRIVGDGKYALELACGMQLNVSERYLEKVKAILAKDCA